MSAELDQLVRDLEAIERFEATYAQTMPRVKRDLKDRIRIARAKEQRAGVPSGLPCSSEAQFNELRDLSPECETEHLVQPSTAVNSSALIPDAVLDRADRGGE